MIITTTLLSPAPKHAWWKAPNVVSFVLKVIGIGGGGLPWKFLEGMTVTWTEMAASLSFNGTGRQLEEVGGGQP